MKGCDDLVPTSPLQQNGRCAPRCTLHPYRGVLQRNGGCRQSAHCNGAATGTATGCNASAKRQGAGREFPLTALNRATRLARISFEMGFPPCGHLLRAPPACPTTGSLPPRPHSTSAVVEHGVKEGVAGISSAARRGGRKLSKAAPLQPPQSARADFFLSLILFKQTAQMSK